MLPRLRLCSIQRDERVLFGFAQCANLTIRESKEFRLELVAEQVAQLEKNLQRCYLNAREERSRVRFFFIIRSNISHLPYPLDL